jgi:hypothetical protein
VSCPTDRSGELAMGLLGRRASTRGGTSQRVTGRHDRGPVEHPSPAALLARRVFVLSHLGSGARDHEGAWRQQGTRRPITDRGKKSHKSLCGPSVVHSSSMRGNAKPKLARSAGRLRGSQRETLHRARAVGGLSSLSSRSRPARAPRHCACAGWSAANFLEWRRFAWGRVRTQGSLKISGRDPR